MRGLGGYTNIVERTIAIVLTKLTSNPRFTARSRHVIGELKKTAPTLRENLQILTSKLRLEPAYFGIGGEQQERQVLRDGSYAEIELRVPSMHWHGFVDILTLSESKCEIVDFKTGEPSPEHEEQIRIYSLLWARDSDLNPHGRIADTLTLSYSKGEVAVKPLSSSELITFEKALMLRTNDALATVQQIPPRAVPSIGNCTFCSVRHLCDDYWIEATQKQLAKGQSEALPSELRKLTDIEVEIEQQESPSVWHGTILSSRLPSSTSSVLIRIPPETHSPSGLIKRGRRLRITDALVIDQTEGEPKFPVISLSKVSEVFVV